MGVKIKLRRVELRKKQKDVAVEVGISNQYLSHLENGQACNPNLEIMRKLARALDSTVQELFFSDEE